MWSIRIWGVCILPVPTEWIIVGGDKLRMLFLRLTHSAGTITTSGLDQCISAKSLRNHVINGVRGIPRSSNYLQRSTTLPAHSSSVHVEVIIVVVVVVDPIEVLSEVGLVEVLLKEVDQELKVGGR